MIDRRMGSIHRAGGVMLSCFVLMWGIINSAVAAETITSYDVTAIVRETGRVDISEKITVTVEHRDIKHGIYRDIPTNYRDRAGLNVTVPLSVDRILRNGIEEPYHLQSQSNGLRIYIGDKDRFVAQGSQQYEIQYHVNRVVGFFNEYDEFYWNVTGNGWIFPIEKARIRLEFPSTAHIEQTAGYTGYQGSREQDFKYGFEANVYEAETTRVLMPAMGFTVAASIQKGIIQPETMIQKIGFFIKDNAVIGICGGSLLLLLIYYMLGWWRYGRDRHGVIVPQFVVPDGMTPDKLSYIMTQGYNNKAFSVLFIEAAVAGYIRMIEEGKTLTIELLKPLPSYSRNSEGMTTLNVVGSLMAGRKTLSIPLSGILRKEASDAVSTTLSNAQSRHKQLLEKQAGQYFGTNRPIRAKAAIISIIGLVLGFAAIQTNDQMGLLWAFGFAHIVVHGVFWRLLKQWTDEGRKWADFGEGLKLYLSIAEEARMNALYPKTVTPQAFEKLLPYALILGVEQEWCNHYDDLIAAGLVPGAEQYDRDRWYRSHRHSWGSIGTGLDSISSSIVSASTPPGSSSGSRGGGSSGGGGGGGGGGGW